MASLHPVLGLKFDFSKEKLIILALLKSARLLWV